jgi:Porin subfamily
MQTMRRLLFGSAAGLVAVTAASAADLPVKAGPVQYVKICSLYGAGFYYMPGTDMCLKIGGWVRAEATWGINGSSVSGIFGADFNNRVTNNVWTRERGYITADAREQTAYGIARGYIAVGINSSNSGNEAPSGQFSSNRAYVQWAGFTAGLAVSFFDFYPAAALLYRAGNMPQGDTGDGGWWVWAYTVQLGGGVSATISAEERRTSQIIAMSAAGGAVGGPAAPGALLFAPGSAGAGYGGWQNPDYIGNLRTDQAWGSAQVMAAAHQLNPSYYGTTPITAHPGDQWGWVVGSGIRVNTPFVAPGDYFVTQVSYTQGATKYLWNPPSNVGESVATGATEGFGVGSDCVFGGTLAAGNATGCLMTTAWEVLGAYEHYWTPQWHESFVGAYLAESYGTGVGSANAMLCVAEAAGVPGTAGTTAAALAGCNNNWSFWGVGSRLQWDVTKSFYIGGEVIYEQLASAQLPGGVVTAPLTLAGSGATTVANESNWQFTIRMHKDFLP